MTINTTRLAAATAGLWGLLALPITQAFPNTDEPIRFTFMYAIMLYPVWAVFGWRWISNDAAVPFKLWGGLTVAAGISILTLSSLHDYQHTFWSPLLTTAVLFTLVIIFDGWQAFRKGPSNFILMIWRRPPVWLSLVGVILTWVIVQTAVGMLTPVLITTPTSSPDKNIPLAGSPEFEAIMDAAYGPKLNQ
ncbi:MAG: hypothetical protein EOP52_13715 [Sphingobacteriales bacterium]|nr:MAG: hypothetical protein EOP52_13715 [Sphingobacteriales bacterium]